MVDLHYSWAERMFHLHGLWGKVEGPNWWLEEGGIEEDKEQAVEN